MVGEKPNRMMRMNAALSFLSPLNLIKVALCELPPELLHLRCKLWMTLIISDLFIGSLLPAGTGDPMVCMRHGSFLIYRLVLVLADACVPMKLNELR